MTTISDSQKIRSLQETMLDHRHSVDGLWRKSKSTLGSFGTPYAGTDANELILKETRVPQERFRCGEKEAIIEHRSAWREDERMFQLKQYACFR